MHSHFQSLREISEKDAARLLVTESAIGQLSFEDACQIVRYMKPKRIKAGGVLVREGERVHNDFMVLILSGDVRVESKSSGAADETIITVLGSGSLIGEMAMINNSPRSATCIASSELAVAVLTRASMKKMLANEPDLAARFLIAVSSQLANRLRETTVKLKKFIQLNNLLQNEVYMLMDAQASPPKRMRQSDMPTEPMSLKTVPAGLNSGFMPSTTARLRTTGVKKK